MEWHLEVFTTIIPQFHYTEKLYNAFHLVKFSPPTIVQLLYHSNQCSDWSVRGPAASEVLHWRLKWRQCVSTSWFIRDWNMSSRPVRWKLKSRLWVFHRLVHYGLKYYDTGQPVRTELFVNTGQSVLDRSPAGAGWPIKDGWLSSRVAGLQWG